MLRKHSGTLHDCSQGLPRSSPVVFSRLASSLAVSSGYPGVSGCLESTRGLSTIAFRACRDLCRWFFYIFLPRSRSLLARLGSPGAYPTLGDSLQLLPGPATRFAAGFFTTCFLTLLLPRVLRKHLVLSLLFLSGPAAIFAAGFLPLTPSLVVSPGFFRVPGA